MAAASTSCSCAGRHATRPVGATGRRFVGRLRRGAEHPDDRRIDEGGRPALAGMARQVDQRVEGDTFDLDALGRRLEARVDEAVAGGGLLAPGVRVPERADGGVDAAIGQATGLLLVPHQRHDLVRRALQRIDHRCPHVAGGSGHEHSHTSCRLPVPARRGRAGCATPAGDVILARFWTGAQEPRSTENRAQSLGNRDDSGPRWKCRVPVVLSPVLLSVLTQMFQRLRSS